MMRIPLNTIPIPPIQRHGTIVLGSPLVGVPDTTPDIRRLPILCVPPGLEVIPCIAWSRLAVDDPLVLVMVAHAIEDLNGVGPVAPGSFGGSELVGLTQPDVRALAREEVAHATPSAPFATVAGPDELVLNTILRRTGTRG